MAAAIGQPWLALAWAAPQVSEVHFSLAHAPAAHFSVPAAFEPHLPQLAYTQAAEARIAIAAATDQIDFNIRTSPLWVKGKNQQPADNDISVAW
jgi:hypothetical protein